MAAQKLTKIYRPVLEKATTLPELQQAIVNAPFADEIEHIRMFLGIVVLLLVNPDTHTIDRVALSNTSFAQGTVQMSVKPFSEIKIPVDYHDNIIAEAIHTGKPTSTTDWLYLFTPALTAQEARFNQAGGGIGYSAVYPLQDVGSGGALIFSYFQYPEELSASQAQFMSDYSELVASFLRTPI